MVPPRPDERCVEASAVQRGPGPDGSSAPTTTPTTTGSSDHPVVVRPTSDPLTWRSVPGSTRDVVTIGADWTLTVSPGGDSAHLDGPHPRTIEAPAHSSISDTFLDLTTVFASKGRGNAFLSPPRCGGDHVTLTAYSAAGDQQVTAAVGAP